MLFFCTIGHIALEFNNVVQRMMLSYYSDAYLISDTSSSGLSHVCLSTQNGSSGAGNSMRLDNILNPQPSHNPQSFQNLRTMLNLAVNNELLARGQAGARSKVVTLSDIGVIFNHQSQLIGGLW